MHHPASMPQVLVLSLLPLLSSACERPASKGNDSASALSKPAAASASEAQTAPQAVAEAQDAMAMPEQLDIAPKALVDGESLLAKPVPQETENLLKNPSFESGVEDWTWLDWSKGWAPFSISYKRSYDGQASLWLPLYSKDARRTVVWGAVQEPELSTEIPDCIEGYYYVNGWSRGNWKQYLQLVIIDQSHSLGPNRGNAQLRYVITGSADAPLELSNAQYLFVEKSRSDMPVLNAWQHFSVNPREDFERHWHYVPSQGAKLRVLFEARYDHYSAGGQKAKSDVYFDQLYMGPKTETRCAAP